MKSAQHLALLPCLCSMRRSLIELRLELFTKHGYEGTSIDRNSFASPSASEATPNNAPGTADLAEQVEQVLEVCMGIFTQSPLTSLGTDIAAFTPIDHSDAIAQLIEIGWYLRDSVLNHADITAGAIALRFGDGCLVTASNTDKYHIGDRVCYIADYLPEKNVIHYVGNGYLPSSESGLVDYAFKEFPTENLILHFHHKPITFAANLHQYRTERYAIYGTPAEAEIVTAQFKRHKFAIASGHGEFVLAANFEEAKAIIDRVLNLLIA